MPGMHVGTQYFATDEKSMQFLQRFGVQHLDALVDDMEIETLRGVMEASAKYGISTDLVHLPALKPGDTAGCPASIKLAQDPMRDEDIALFCRAIENAGAVGLRGICWHFCVLENQRSPDTPGRGGTSTSSLYAADYDNDTLCEAAVLNGGYVTRDEVRPHPTAPPTPAGPGGEWEDCATGLRAHSLPARPHRASGGALQGAALLPPERPPRARPPWRGALGLAGRGGHQPLPRPLRLPLPRDESLLR